MRFKEFINPGVFAQGEVSPFGSGRSLELPDYQMRDLTITTTGRIVDVQRIRGRSVVDREEGRSKIKITAKTPEGIFHIDHSKNSIPIIGKPITIILDRNRNIINYKLEPTK